MAPSSNSSLKLDETNSNFIIKLKLPNLDLPSSSHHNSNTNNQDYQEVVEQIKEIKEDALPLPPSTPSLPPPAAATKEGVEVEVVDGSGVGEVKLHICPLCNKGFTSGKALGGHKSSHKFNETATQKIKEMVVRSNNNNNQEVFKCSYCPKEFPSIKSLYGHMRSHPHRLHRGMNPSKELLDYYKERGNSEVSESSSMAENRLRRLGTWRVTGKRGRKGWFSMTSSSSDVSLDSPEAEAFQAAETLMLLSRGVVGCGNRVYDVFDGSDDVDFEVKRAKKGKGLMTSSCDIENENSFDDDEAYYLEKLGYLPNYEDDVNNNTMIDDDDDEEPIKVTPIRMLSPNRSEIKKTRKNNQKIIKSAKLEYTGNNYHPDEYNKWVCTTCGKSFPTHQALGGHRSSHYKDKNNNTIIVQTRVVDGSGITKTDNSGDSGSNDASHDNVAVSGIVAVHKCKICDKTFSSGQALGGHQRSHYVVPSPDKSSSPDQTSSQTSRIRENTDLFDLNVVPVDDVENDNLF